MQKKFKSYSNWKHKNSFSAEPNNDSPLNTHASGLWSNKTAYQKLLLEKYKEAQEPPKGS